MHIEKINPLPFLALTRNIFFQNEINRTASPIFIHPKENTKGTQKWRLKPPLLPIGPVPAIVIEQISSRIKSLTDFVGFRAVCPSWRSASLSEPRHLPSQIPWLMVPYNPSKIKNPNDDSIRLFYDLYQSKMHKIHLPETRHMMCCATSKGWLLLVAEEGRKVELLNPLTREKITLPNFTTPVNIFSIKGTTYDASAWFVPFIGNFVITKMIFSSDPTKKGCVITVFLQKTCRLFFCRVGDPCWTLVNQDPEEIRIEKPSDGTFFNNKFYLLAHDGYLRVYDLNAPNRGLCRYDPALQFDNKYFLEGKSGIYLVASHDSGGRRREGNEDQQGEEDESSGKGQPEVQEDDTHKAFELYQILDPEYKVKPIKNTSNITIFHGDNNNYLAFYSEGWDSVKGDHIYVGTPCQPSNRNMGENEREIGPLSYGIFLASLEEGEGKKIVSDLGEQPDLRPPAPALWFQPKLI